MGRIVLTVELCVALQALEVRFTEKIWLVLVGLDGSKFDHKPYYGR